MADQCSPPALDSLRSSSFGGQPARHTSKTSGYFGPPTEAPERAGWLQLLNKIRTDLR